LIRSVNPSIMSGRATTMAKGPFMRAGP
jgi:hypothetical protein